MKFRITDYHGDEIQLKHVESGNDFIVNKALFQLVVGDKWMLEDEIYLHSTQSAKQLLETVMFVVDKEILPHTREDVKHIAEMVIYDKLIKLEPKDKFCKNCGMKL